MRSAGDAFPRIIGRLSCFAEHFVVTDPVTPTPSSSPPPVAPSGADPVGLQGPQGAQSAQSALGPIAPAALNRAAVPGVSSLIIVGLAVALVAAGWNWYDTRRELGKVREEVTIKLRDNDLEGRESRTVARRAEEEARGVAAKFGVLEARISESQGQQVALEQLYQELSRGRDEWTLAEIEQTLGIASQQLQLAGNIQGALAALQTADARLARSDRPQFIPLRRAISKDIERLKAAPNLDIPGLTLKLDQVVSAVDTMTLLADGRPTTPLAESTSLEGFWSRLGALVWSEVRQLVRIQRLDQSDQGLLTPEQSYFLRENMKLRLLAARVALLQRNEITFRADVKSASDWLTRYFDPRQPSVVASQSTLEGLNRAAVVVDLPTTLTDSLAAARSVKLVVDKSRE